MKIVLALMLLNSLSLSFNYKETNPYSLFPYYTAVSDLAPFGHLSNPAYLPLWEAAYLSVDYGKPYQMNEMNSGNIRAGYSSSSIGIQAAWNRFGIQEYYEDIFEGNFGYRPWKFLSTGLGTSLYCININTEDINFKYRITDFNFSILFLPFEFINIGFYQENIHSMIDKEEEEDFLFPNQSLGMAIKPARGITLSWNINRIYYGYINSFSITANMLSCLSLKGGYSSETSSYSFSINFMYHKLMVSYGLSYHTYLGSTHKLGVTIASNDFKIERVNYNKSLYRSLPEKKKKININNSSLEELIESKLFPREITERIIKYRTVMGPITRKGIVQIGISEKELKDMEKYITGIAKEPQPQKDQKVESVKIRKKRTRRGYDIDTRKLLFQKLLENGLSASAALEIAELAKDKNKKELILIINESSNINEEKKKIIIEICTDLLQ